MAHNNNNNNNRFNGHNTHTHISGSLNLIKNDMLISSEANQSHTNCDSLHSIYEWGGFVGLLSIYTKTDMHICMHVEPNFKNIDEKKKYMKYFDFGVPQIK